MYDVTTLFVILEEGMDDGDLIRKIEVRGKSVDVEYTDMNGEEGIITLQVD